MPTVTPEPIIKVAVGFMAAKHLFVASEVGLFEALAAGPQRSKSLRARPVFRYGRSPSRPRRWSVSS